MKIPAPRFETRLGSGSIDAERRTVDMTFYDGANVPRFSWSRGSYNLEFSMDPAHIRMGRLESGGAPLLDSHDDLSLCSVLGVIEEASIQNGKGVARARFAMNDPQADAAWNKVSQGILRNVSMGAAVYKMQEVGNENDPIKSYMAIDWEPMEVSLVAVGADPGASIQFTNENKEIEVEVIGNETLSAINSTESETDPSPAAEEQMSGATAQLSQEEEETIMSEALNTNVAGTLAAPVIDEAKLQAERLAERTRAKDIRSRVATAKLAANLAEAWVEEGVSVELASERIFTELAKQTAAEAATASQHTAQITHDKGDKVRETMSATLLHRYEPTRYKDQAAAGREWMGYSLMEMARECLRSKGVSFAGKGPGEVAQLALTTSDFPNILADVANKTLRAGYENYPNTFQAFCKRATATDFKNINRTQLSGAPALVLVNEHGEIKQGSLTDSKETYAIATYARIVNISRKTIINDDLSALTRVPELMGRKAAILEGDLVWAKITTNPNMSDSNALFSSAHNNLAGVSAALAVATIDSASTAITKQTGLEGDTLNLMPKYLLIPVALRLIANQILFPTLYPATVGNTVPNYITALTPIVEPRLDVNSATSFYLTADPSQVDTLEYTYLEGQEGMYFESQMGFDVDGIKMKARHDFGAGVIDFRGMYKNAGA